MISVDDCRDLLGPECPMTDKDIAGLREQLYELAVFVIELAEQEWNDERNIEGPV